MKEYLVGVVAAALICGIVTRLLGAKGTTGAAGKLLTGAFLSLALVAPLTNISLEDLENFPVDYEIDAQLAASDGLEAARSALADGIKERVETYILDEAASLGVSLSVEVTLSNDEIPTPHSVRLAGQVSPYAKNQLSNIIDRELGMDKEHQTWT